MREAKDLFCNRVIGSFNAIRAGMMALHGRGVYNMFGLYANELASDIHTLVSRNCMTVDMEPNRPPDGMVMLAELAVKNARRMRYVWDYFVFIYMSHKADNIKRRQKKDGALEAPLLLYLRGADYQYAVERNGAAMGNTTLDDARFRFGIITELGREFIVSKVLSPADLHYSMMHIGPYLARHGNSLGSVAEFAREMEEGLFFNPMTWKERVPELFSSAALFLVYVSNQSKGLSYEIESLLHHGLQENTILVLDDKRFEARKGFFDAQARMRDMGLHLYEEVNPEAVVEDPAHFEELLSRFPYKVMQAEDTEVTLREIKELISTVLRTEATAPSEIPFDFHVVLSPDDETQVAAVRRHVSDFINQSVDGKTLKNWPVLVLYLELDILLNLAFGRPLEAARSAARYGAIADFMRDFLAAKQPERAAEIASSLKTCGDVGIGVALVAFALGSWNDYSDRRTLARAEVDSIVEQMTALLSRSVERHRALVYKAKEDVPNTNKSDHVQLIEDMLEANKILNRDDDDE